MSSPIVSVIVPAYNNAEFLGATIQSVLDQSYPHFELIVVNDASPDNVDEVVQQFHDPRIRTIVHATNQGLSAARNTGMRASTGAIIALLDGDDLFLPDKLREHVAFLDAHPEIGVSYNARFELDHSALSIRELWRPPRTVDLRDLVAHFPFSPSDMVLRREWAFRVGLFDEYHVYVGEDLDINVRLALAGCRFGGIDRALNLRRYHAGRRLGNLPGVIADTLRPLDAAFADPRCPEAVRQRKDQAYATHYMLWAAIAFGQEETAVGQEFARAALQRDPRLLLGHPSPFLAALIAHSCVDESVDHDALLRAMLDQLPPAGAGLDPADCDDAVAHGYLILKVRTALWRDEAYSRQHFARAAAPCYCRCPVPGAAMATVGLRGRDGDGRGASGPGAPGRRHGLLGTPHEVRRLKGSLALNRAFQDFHAGNFTTVLSSAAGAPTAHNPTVFGQPCALSILLRSVVANVRPEEHHRGDCDTAMNNGLAHAGHAHASFPLGLAARSVRRPLANARKCGCVWPNGRRGICSTTALPAICPSRIATSPWDGWPRRAVPSGRANGSSATAARGECGARRQFLHRLGDRDRPRFDLGHPLHRAL
ncbi:MAG: glycosyltransferase family A protein [Caldilineaceae bacterium]